MSEGETLELGAAGAAGAAAAQGEVQREREEADDWSSESSVDGD